MSFLTKPELFGAQSGDEEWHDNKGRFKIPKVEAESNQETTDETDDETAAGIELVQLSVDDDATESEEEAVVTKPSLEPTENAAAAHRHKDVTREQIETSQETATTVMKPQTATPSTSKGKTTSPHTTDLEKRSFQIALAANNTLDESGSESDSNTPARVLRRNIDEVLRTPEVLTTLLRYSIESKLVIQLQNGERIVVGEDWCKDVEIPTKLKIKSEEKKKGSGKGKRSNQTQNHENAEAKEPEVTKNSSQHDAPELNDPKINKNETAAEPEATVNTSQDAVVQ